MPEPKVVRLRTQDTAISGILNDLLEDDMKDEIEGLVIIATLKDGMIRRWCYDKERRCSSIIGLIEYMKQYLIDDMRNDEGDL